MSVKIHLDWCPKMCLTAVNHSLYSEHYFACRGSHPEDGPFPQGKTAFVLDTLQFPHVAGTDHSVFVLASGGRQS